MAAKARDRAEKWPESGSVLVCCLSCHRSEPDDPSSPGEPQGLIAPFARRNFYALAVRMMRTVTRGLSAANGFALAPARIFCNSRIPEKPLLAASGIASYGKNSLTIAPGLGSLFVIAGAVLPVALEGGTEAGTGDPCGSCRRCMDACPTGAIIEPGIVDPGRCLQGLAADPVRLAPEIMEKWGARIYGCQDCQTVCPHNSRLTVETPTSLGELGPGIPLRRLLSLDPPGVKRMLKGTALEMSWISGEALLRNAIIAAGNRGDACLRKAVEGFAVGGSPGCTPLLRETARWALDRMRRA